MRTGGKTRGRRPTELAGAGKRYTVYLLPSEVAMLKRIGGGKVGTGVRRLIGRERADRS